MRRISYAVLLLFTLFCFTSCGYDPDSVLNGNLTETVVPFSDGSYPTELEETSAIITRNQRTVDLHLQCQPNALFNKYNLSVLLDGKEIGILEHGTEQVIRVQASNGVHSLQFKSTADDTASEQVDFTVGDDSTEFSYRLKCQRDRVEVDYLTPETLSPETLSPETLPPETLPSETLPSETLPSETLPSETLLPETLLPETLLPETLLPETLPPEPLPPETLLPETLPPETLLPETLPPEPLPPETLPSETLPPETLAPETKPSGGASGGGSVTVPDHEETEGWLVWVPVNGGTKYHRSSTCSSMKEPMQVTVETAEENGYTPCKRCYG